MASNHAKRGPRIEVRESGIHGRGVFARRAIRQGETVCEYKGELITEAEIERRYPEDRQGVNHTFVFSVSRNRNIDGGSRGNVARWINHSCDPNCESYEKDKRIFIAALRDIRRGEELFYDYCVESDEPVTKALKALWPCWCGTKKCRGTVLLPPPRMKTRKKKRTR